MINAAVTPEEIAAVRRPYRAASLLPGRAYHDPAIHDFERREWFRRDWIVVGREEDAPSAGTYFLAEVDDEPLAHRPRSRRRAARLLQRLPPPRDGGRRGGLRQGRPVPVPVPRLDLRPRGQAHPGQAHRGPRRLQLRRVRPRVVRIETWQGFVFVNLVRRGTATGRVARRPAAAPRPVRLLGRSGAPTK